MGTSSLNLYVIISPNFQALGRIRATTARANANTRNAPALLMGRATHLLSFIWALFGLWVVCVWPLQLLLAHQQVAYKIWHALAGGFYKTTRFFKKYLLKCRCPKIFLKLQQFDLSWKDEFLFYIELVFSTDEFSAKFKTHLLKKRVQCKLRTRLFNRRVTEKTISV